MPRYAVELEWNGSDYAGTAIQKSDVTLSCLFNNACAQIEEADARIRCSSRLDAGVSARALPAHIDLHKQWPLSSLAKALNAHLPDALAVRRIAEVDGDWDALREPSVKHYCYRVLHRPWKAVLDTALWQVTRLDHSEYLPSMAAMIAGDCDLSAFACLRGDETDQQDPKRHYHEAIWTMTEEQGGQLWCFRIAAEGFLYKQVRGLVGSMVAIAQGSYPMSEFERMCREGRASQQHSGNIAPAKGLYLERVIYQRSPEWQDISWD